MQGEAYIAEDVDFDGNVVFHAYWDRESDQQGEPTEQRKFESVGQALEWGRERAAIVLIRLVASDYYSAGELVPPWAPDTPLWTGKELDTPRAPLESRSAPEETALDPGVDDDETWFRTDRPPGP